MCGAPKSCLQRAKIVPISILLDMQAALTANVIAFYQALHFQHRSCVLASCYTHWNNHVPQCV